MLFRSVVGGRAGDGRPGDGRLSAGRRVAVVLHLAVAALVLCLGGRAAAVCARRWDTIARATGIGVTELLLIALMTVGLALAAAAGALGNALYTARGDDPSPGGRWRPARWAAVAAPTLAAALILAGSAAVVQLRSPEDAPAAQRTAAGLPANPTSFSPEPAWSRDIAELTDIVARGGRPPHPHPGRPPGPRPRRRLDDLDLPPREHHPGLPGGGRREARRGRQALPHHEPRPQLRGPAPARTRRLPQGRARVPDVNQDRKSVV